MTDRLPAIFFGHGNPMNALLRNSYTQAWEAVGSQIPRPKTIHDFGGFPRELFEVKYPAPGDPELARRVRQLLAPLPVDLEERWGLDHGTWAVLRHVYPHADVPVVQLSIDEMRAAPFHYEIGKRLAPLREEGILIVGSGNFVHNLHAY